MIRSRAAAALLALSAVGGTAARLHAQYPRGERGRFEVRGFDFRPEGAWRRRATAVRERRLRLLRSGAIGTLNAPAVGVAAITRVSGDFQVPVILVRPSNVLEPFAPQQYAEILFTDTPRDRPYSLSSFYRQLSNDRILLHGEVFGWRPGSQRNTYYEDGCNGIGVLGQCAHTGANGLPTRLGELLLEALADVDTVGTVDWGKFDNDGPDGIPNSGDDDGYVDFVTFIHADVDGACGTSHLWSHRWVISAWNGGVPYITKTPRNGPSGGNILIDDYTLQSGVGGSTACTAVQIMPIGTVAHETGHAFGLPDLYDTDVGAAGHTQGIGEWGLMGSGNYRSPDSPARYEAWSLAEMGWVTVDTLNASRLVTAGPVTASDTVFYVPVANRNEYFLLENRQPLESDSALLNPARPGGKSPGLLIWHIDNDRVAANGFRTTNTVNTGRLQGVALMQADGRNDLRMPGTQNRGDAGDPYPGSTANQKFSWLSTPRAEDNAGAFAGFMVDQIAQVSARGPIRFRFTRRGLSVMTAAMPGVQVLVNGAPYARYEEVLAPGDAVRMGLQTVQVSSGLERFAFTAWSNGQPASFTLAPDPLKPDTLVANFQRLVGAVVTVQGTGAVVADPSMTRDSVFVVPGTGVTLTATPTTGAQFLGWVGDTTASEPSLRLPMQHGYVVRAAFSVSSEVAAVVDAVRAVLTDPTQLSPEVRSGLDWQGNRNSLFDVGDVLAYIDRTRGTVPAALVRQLIAQASARPPVATPGNGAGGGHR